MDLMPTATWIKEKPTSDDQELNADEYVSFNFHGLECKIAQSLLVSVVTIQAFQELFVPLAAEACVEAIEKASIGGDGKGKPLGVLNEPRIPQKNKITLNSEEFSTWKGWKSKVFAAMKKRYRRGTFLMAQGTFDGQIDGMVDLQGQPIGRVNYGIDGEETYRFGGREVLTVEDDILPAYEDAEENDVVAIFMRLRDYGINTNMQMRIVHWVDNDNNKRKVKAIVICDGKVLNPWGILLIKKGKTVTPSTPPPTDPPTP